MCRFFAYLGPPQTLDALLLAPEHSLVRQSYAPRRQQDVRLNADGFGCGWYERSLRREPALYRTTLPAWGDRNFASLAGLITSSSMMAAVRSAEPALPIEEASTAPFSNGKWLFAHNGMVDGYLDPGGAGVAGVALRRLLSDKRLAGIEGASDSALLFALVLDRLDGGAPPDTALTNVVQTVLERTTARLNLVLTDGDTIAATAYGNTLFTLHDAGLARAGVIVASEPCDDHAAWQEVPDGTIIRAAPNELTSTRLHPATPPPPTNGAAAQPVSAETGGRVE